MNRFHRIMDAFGDLFPIYAVSFGGVLLLCKLADIIAQAWFA